MIRLYKTLGSIAVALALITAPTASFAAFFVGVDVNVGFAPPVLPVYEQPPCPVEGYLWTPGYWGYGDYGYYWVPGTWVAPPSPGYLWTPGYWAFSSGLYGWHPGYWGLTVGFYGGVNYGFGYGGVGYVGGGWFGNAFRYNTAVTNVNTTVINNTYIDRNVTVNNYNSTNASYNGGPNGTQARPTPAQLASAENQDQHLPPTAAQTQNARTASQNRNYFASVNGGHPEQAAVAQPLSRSNRPEGFAPPTAEDRANRPDPAVQSQPGGTDREAAPVGTNSGFHQYDASGTNATHEPPSDANQPANENGSKTSPSDDDQTKMPSNGEQSKPTQPDDQSKLTQPDGQSKSTQPDDQSKTPSYAQPADASQKTPSYARPSSASTKTSASAQSGSKGNRKSRRTRASQPPPAQKSN